ncbi:hypothetical protein [Planctomicrobium piriforme]|uniref:Lipoprotein n=1 Tax=Planctomicrobium piriforme TaxID=1576369 RepID=A0A1I3DDP2_9PLAN|nr:hypothetical protein [Planctomicrobium piriforme]SFH84591.1 hypothetical protein SAMN05421753_103186 [Planctomicrobium piriforme]
MAVKKSIRHWLSLLAFAPLAGCATFQDVHYEHTQKLRTECAYFHYWWCSGSSGSDYAKGWKAGYMDVLTGGDGQPPLVAPHCYWAPSQITKHCDEKRHDYYVGWQDGAMMASLEPDTHYVKVWNPAPVCRTAAYEETSGPTPSTTSEPALAPPSEAPSLTPTPGQDDSWNATPSDGSSPLNPNLPPVPEQPEPIK